MSFGDLQTPEQIAALDAHLADNSFLGTDNATNCSEPDLEMLQKLSQLSISTLRQNPNIFRWSKSVISQVQCRQLSCGDIANDVGAVLQLKDTHNRPAKGTKKVETKQKLPHPGKKIEPEAYLAKRVQRWDELRDKHNAWLQNKKDTESADIKITLPDGSQKEGKSWETSPMDIAKGISNSLAKQCIIARVNGDLWDMTRPFESDATLALLKFSDKAAKEVFWHSSAHVIGEAMEQYLGGSLVFGPPLEDGGFYYDIDSQYTLAEKDFGPIEKVVQDIVKENQPFERLMVSKQDLLDMFEYNPFKQKVLREKVTTEYTSAYRCGTLIDLCRGPHLENTGKIKAFKCLKTSSAYFQGKADQESLTRLYGISFPDKKLLKEWEKFQQQARERDHRKIGKEQELFTFNEYSPGSCFWFPKGAYIYNTLMDFMKEEYRKRGFREVMSPNMFDADLWRKSGHWQHYQDDIFNFEVEKKQWALKPMNCPGHCVMFGTRSRSFRELPLRFADFGVLHRNELAGALSGLTRVRRFQQDDAHIFCTPDQIESEIQGAIDFLDFVISKTLGMKYKLFLSTRPEGYIGTLDVWDAAEAQLKKALTEHGCDFEIDEGGGAFYGPKIDIKVTDALNRTHQTATVQLDFNLPSEKRFALKYTDQNNTEQQPVIIHRAILGSLERQIAIITENFGGKWPLWLSPRQVKVITVSDKFADYGREVCDKLYSAGLEAEIETDSGLTLNKKIRNAQIAQFNFQMIIGETEQTNRTVNVRTRDNQRIGEQALDFVVDRLVELKKARVLNAEEVFLPPAPAEEKVE